VYFTVLIGGNLTNVHLSHIGSLNPLFQTGDVVYGEGKLRDLGMVFKPCFKCFKNEKINFIQAFLNLETLLFQNMFILFYLILYL